MPAASSPQLLLGPALRHVDAESATIWVEVDRPCEVEVLGRRVQTFRVEGHHYALVVVEGLEPGSVTPYEVCLDGTLVWPLPDPAFPPSRIRTVGRAGPFRIAFGSCRYARHETVDTRTGMSPDALDTYAGALLTMPETHWPDALVFLGDQVYADNVTPGTREWLAARRDLGEPPYDTAADFEEYTRLYLESWTDPRVRWLLSTVPSAMVFDDHEIIDDWNTSAGWRAERAEQDWWPRRIHGGLMSYWVYQHLGNLSPAALAGDDTWQAVQRRAGADAGPVLRRMARAADEAPGSLRWSYVRRWAAARLVVVDTRAGRVLEEHRRAMLDETEFTWVERAVREAVADGVDHLLVGSSLPWLLPQSIHHAERWNETLVTRHSGRPLGRLSERLRQAADLEHWAAFGRSFERLGRVLVAAARGDLGTPPATAVVLSGDVHHAYAAELVAPSGLAGRIHQITVSPLHNRAPRAVELGFTAGWGRWARGLTRAVAWLGRVQPTRLRWRKAAGPFFGDLLGELVLDGRRARFVLFRVEQPPAGPARVREVADLPLAEG
jgi:phosphodiesterase/alkaline phosphatase D-like protein